MEEIAEVQLCRSQGGGGPDVSFCVGRNVRVRFGDGGGQRRTSRWRHFDVVGCEEYNVGCLLIRDLTQVTLDKPLQMSRFRLT